MKVSNTGEVTNEDVANEDQPSLEPGSSDPILMLDQEQINRLENVLRSEEAKDFLGEVLSNANPNESLGDFLSPSEVLASNVSEALESEGSSSANTNKSNEDKKNKRRSQRQIDRELKEEAERIRKENQELLKKEKEAMNKQSGDTPSATETKTAQTPTQTTATGR